MLAFAEHGYIGVRKLSLRFPFVHYVAGPAGGFWGIDEWADSALADVVEIVGPWGARRV